MKPATFNGNLYSTCKTTRWKSCPDWSIGSVCWNEVGPRPKHYRRGLLAVRSLSLRERVPRSGGSGRKARRIALSSGFFSWCSPYRDRTSRGPPSPDGGFAHKVDEAGFLIDPLPPSAAVPLMEGDTNTSKINESYSLPREGESRRRRQGVDGADFLCKAPDGRRKRAQN